jgi:hypothetical protein
MNDKEFEQSRFIIIKDFFNYYNLLNLEEDIGISISSSSPGIYHIFSRHDGILIHQYSISDIQLGEIAKNIKLSTVKTIFVNTKIKSYENKLIKKYNNEINPLDFENCH